MIKMRNKNVLTCDKPILWSFYLCRISINKVQLALRKIRTRHKKVEDMERSRKVVHVRIDSNHPRFVFFFVHQEVDSEYAEHSPQLERVTKLPYHADRLIIVENLLREGTSNRSERLAIDLLIRS